MVEIKFATWNVNSILTRLEPLLEFLNNSKPNFVLLQETKCIDENFPKQILANVGYKSFVNGQKSYNGVAILAKNEHDCEIMEKDFNLLSDGSARYIEILTKIGQKQLPLTLASIYVPNGSSLDSSKFVYKIEFLKSLRDYLEEATFLEKNFIIGGDFNVAYNEKDVPDAYEYERSVGFTLKERLYFRRIFDLGFYDCFRLSNPSEKSYTWWDYRAGAFDRNLGMRIDYVLASSQLCDNLLQTSHEKIYRSSFERPSDHIPVVSTFNID